MNASGFLELVTEAMASWVKRQCIASGIEGVDEVVLIGIDCWGAVLASQISVKLGVPNYCVAARAKGQYHSHREKVSQNVVNAVAKHRLVFLVTDVVVSGGTVRFIFDEISKMMMNSETLRWFALAIFVDEMANRGMNFDFINACGAACKDLRFPKLDSSLMPPEGILPWSTSFQ